MGTYQYVGTLSCLPRQKIRVRYRFEPFAGKSLHLGLVMDDCPERIQPSVRGKKLLRLAYGPYHTVAKARIPVDVDFQIHIPNFENRIPRSQSISPSNVISLLSSSMASAALVSGDVFLCVSI